MMLSDVCLSVAYIGHRGSPRHTWLGQHFQGQKVKGKVKVTRPLYSPPCWRVRRLLRWAWVHISRGKLLLRCRLLGDARRFGAHGGGEGRGHTVAAARLQLVNAVIIRSGTASFFNSYYDGTSNFASPAETSWDPWRDPLLRYPLNTLCFKKKFTLLLFAITKSDVDRFQ